MEELFPCSGVGGDRWKCQKHPSAQPNAGAVCPACLHDRLLRLCPDCGGKRAYGCSCHSNSSTASSSSSSLSSISSLDLHGRGAAGANVGTVGRVAHLIDCEPAFRRSRSAAAFRLLRPRPDAAAGRRDGGERTRPAGGGVGGRSWLWPFQRGKRAGDEGASDEAAAAAALSRSRSVGAIPGACPNPVAVDRDGPARGEVRSKAWNRYFPSPMKAFRNRQNSKVVRARFPLVEVKEDAG